MDNKLIPPPSDNPKTGDNSNMTLWLALMGVSVATLIVLGVSRKRRKVSEVKENENGC
ncbi:LPXTG cell wall anchor domain-containing protein [Eubacteriales bacterium OttesenSCG-928-G02]|nr:LPXTG cell wall anchor domain-containing protein [Eubacteriales bacterium OttesenSCG-928-G02]